MRFERVTLFALAAGLVVLPTGGASARPNSASPSKGRGKK